MSRDDITNEDFRKCVGGSVEWSLGPFHTENGHMAQTEAVTMVAKRFVQTAVQRRVRTYAQMKPPVDFVVKVC